MSWREDRNNDYVVNQMDRIFNKNLFKKI